jgi:hypothetical protein
MNKKATITIEVTGVDGGLHWKHTRNLELPVNNELTDEEIEKRIDKLIAHIRKYRPNKKPWFRMWRYKGMFRL